MKVIEITKKQEWSEQKKNLFGQNGIVCQCVSPTLLSPFTAMKVRRAVEKSEAVAIIITDLRNAMAALSARQLLQDNSVKIVYMVQANSKPPKGIPTAIAQDIDSWIFPTERMHELYPSDLKNAVVIPVADFDAVVDADLQYDQSGNGFLWVGPIDGNEENLKKAIEAVDALPFDCKLKILGTGKAQNVMPAVRKSRAICNPSRIEWLGAEATLQEAVNGARYVVQAGLDPTDMEMGLAANLNLISAGQITHLESAQPVAAISAGEAARRIADHIKNL